MPPTLDNQAMGVFLLSKASGRTYKRRSDGYINVAKLLSKLETPYNVMYMRRIITQLDIEIAPLTSFRDDVWCHPRLFFSLAHLDDGDFRISISHDCAECDEYFYPALDVLPPTHPAIQIARRYAQKTGPLKPSILMSHVISSAMHESAAYELNLLYKMSCVAMRQQPVTYTGDELKPPVGKTVTNTRPPLAWRGSCYSDAKHAQKKTHKSNARKRRAAKKKKAKAKLQLVLILEANAEIEQWCVVCFENAPTAMLSPCGHSSTCTACADQLTSCCLCRAPIASVAIIE
jgi:hypothetical protein